MATGNATFKAEPAEIADVFGQHLPSSVVTAATEKAAPFAYHDFGPPGEVVEQVYSAASDSWDGIFANGVRFHLKLTHFEPHISHVSLHFGEGRLSEPKDKVGLGMLVVGHLMRGLRKHTFEQLRMLLAGTHGELAFNVNEEGFNFTSESTAENTLLLMQILTAYVVDPAFREEGRSRTSAVLSGIYQSWEDGPEAVLNEKVIPLLANGEARMGVPPPAQLGEYSPADFKAWFLPRASRLPMDITLVGDLSHEAALALAAQTVGALPPLQPATPLPPGLVRFPRRPLNLTLEMDRTNSKSSYLEFYWPLRNAVSGQEQVQLSVLADIVKERLLHSIRGTLGKTYTPLSRLELHRNLPNYGWLSFQIETSAADLKSVQTACLGQVAELVKNGISLDELLRVQQVQITALESERQTNAYWLDLMVNAARYPEVREIRDRGVEMIKATTVADLDKLAKTYLRKDQVSIFRLVLKTQAPAHCCPKQLKIRLIYLREFLKNKNRLYRRFQR